MLGRGLRIPKLKDNPILQYVLTRWIRLGFLLTTSVIASLLEFIGMGVLIPIVLMKLSDGAQGQLGNIKGAIARFVPTIPGVELATTLMIFFICILLMRSLFRILQVYAQERLLTSWKGDLSRMILEEYIFNGYRNIYNIKKSAMMTTVNMANKFFDKTVMAAIDSVSASIVALAFLGAVAYLDPPTAAIAVLIITVIIVVQRFVTNSLAGSMEDEDVAFGQRRQQALNEVLSMSKEVKLLNREQSVIGRFSRANRLLNKRSTKLKTINEMPRALAQAFFVITIGLAVFYVSAEANNPRTQVSVVLIVFVGLRLLPRVNRIQNAMQSFAETKSVRTKIAAILRSHTNLINKPWRIQGIGVRKQLLLEQVQFSHADSSRPALQDISFSIKAGQFVAIIGESGAGKSTLMDILMGLLNPDGGQILADGRPVSRDTGIWKRLGYLSQNPMFIDGSIKENIALGAKNREIDTDRIQEAIRFAGLESFVNAAPQMLNTPVGDNADQLSAGERQRLGLARAYFNAEDVIFLDEPTANLDPVTEASIIDSLHNRPKNLTVVMIAHRHTTIKEADQVIHLKNGRISACGTYDELFARELIHA